MRKIIALVLLFSILGAVHAIEKKQKILNDGKILAEGRKHLINYYKKKNIEDFDLAVNRFKRVLKIEPDNETALIMLGNIYNFRSKQIADNLAKKELKNKRNHFAVANLFLSQNRYEESLKQYDICQKEFPKWTCPMRHKGEALLKLGRYNESVDVLKKSISIRKNHFDAYVFLGKALVSAKRYKEAKAAVDNAISCYKKDKGCGENDQLEALPVDCTKLYVEIYKNLGDYKKLKYYKSKLKKK